MLQEVRSIFPHKTLPDRVVVLLGCGHRMVVLDSEDSIYHVALDAGGRVTCFECEKQEDVIRKGGK